MIAKRALVAATIAAALGPGCSSSNAAPLEPLSIADGCQPLVAPTSCTLPYPSDFFVSTDPKMPSGRRVAFGPAARPRSTSDVEIDVTAPFPPDGASLQPAITAVLPGAITSDGLPNVVDGAEASTDRQKSPTLLLRADDGTAVAHYVDVDPNANEDGRVALVLRPFAPLEPKTRYVAVLRGVKMHDGFAPAAEGFRRLRDRTTDRDPSLAALAPRFERDVFGTLDRARVPRESVQLAWDFTTGTRERSTADLLRVRELTLAWLETHAPAVKVTSIDAGSGSAWRIVRGTIEGPRFVDRDGPGALLRRDADGAVTLDGTTTWEWVAVVPASLRDAYDPGRALAFGHGFFGGRDEVVDGRSVTIVQKLGAVAIGIDWWGMSKPDLDAVIDAVTKNPSHTTDFVERVHQAMANWLVTTAALRGPLAQLPELHRPASGPGTSEKNAVSNAGALLYDPSHVFYFGASQAHILGGVMCALNPDVERAVLDVGGAGFTQIMPRSNAFSAFQFILKTTVGEELTLQTVLSMLTAGLDRIDPATYAPWLVGSHLPKNPDRKVLLQVGIGDSSVPAVAGFFHARALGVAQTSPPVASLFGIPEAPAESLGSALTVYDFGISMDVYRLPVSRPDNEVHVGLRVEPTALEQTNTFLAVDGKVIHPCNGPCRLRP